MFEPATPTPTASETPATESNPQSDIETLRAQLQAKEDSLVSKFDGLTRRERMLMQKEQELKQKLGQAGSVDELKELASKDPLKLLERFGLSYDKLTDLYAGMVPEDETRSKVNNVTKELEDLKRKLEEGQAEGQMKEIMRVKDAKLEGLKSLASREGSDYTLVSQFGNFDDVLLYMSEHYNATGEILSDDEALEHVERRLEESLKVLKGNAKLQKLFGLSGEPAQNEREPDVQNGTFGLHDSKLKTETPKTDNTRGLSDQQLFELALSKMPQIKL
jgi:hypothetical protein